MIPTPGDQRLFAAAQDDMRAGRWDEAVAKLEVLAAHEVRNGAGPSEAALRVPALIKPYTLGPLIAVALTGSAGLSGLAISVLGLSRFLVAYPLGRIADTYGRKPGLQLGLTLGLVGTILVGLSILWGSFPAFLGALLLFSMGLSAIHQLRVAAADMYPPARRGQALGWVLTGTVVGIFVTPILVAAGQAVAATSGLDPLALPWLFTPVVILPGMLCVALVRPDPRDIAARLEAYYPGYQPRRGERRAAVARSASRRSCRTIRCWSRSCPTSAPTATCRW